MRDLSEFVEWELVKTVYNQLPSLIAGAFALAAGAFIGWLRTREVGFLVWSIVICLVATSRLLLDVGFHRALRTNRAQAGRASARTWRNRFGLGAWAMGAMMGIAGWTITLPVDPFLRMLLISIQLVLIMGAVTRNAGSPGAAKGQIVIGLAPMLLACIMVHSGDLIIYFLFGLFELAAALGVVRYLHRQLVRLLRTVESNIELARAAEIANMELAAVNARLEHTAVTDALTAIGNRRRFDEALNDEFRRAQRDGGTLSLLMLDIDSFKGFNDLYGHLAGDACLKQVAQTLSSALRRPADVVARYGGEEFGAILPKTDSPAAAALAEHIRGQIEALAISSSAGAWGVVTVSVGVATFAAAGANRPQDVIHAADEALYEAKRAGRNCVRIAAGIGPQLIDAT